jgi:predicted acyltransferase
VKVTAHHIESLDVFRGITVAAMILVNNPGDWSAVFPPLVHANWTGWTFADLLFPWFLFIMGFTMPLALARRRTQGQQTHHLHRRIIRRAVLLIALGLVLNAVAGPWTSPLRFPGVLQRIALVYVVATLTVLHLDVAGWIAVAVALLLGHWALLTLVPFEGYPAGTLTPDHNLARYLDTLVFGRHVLASARTDPEGLLGTMSAVATALGGAVAGHLWRSASSSMQRTRALVILGVIALAAGLAWSWVLPLSKPLWTPSYALMVTGLAALTLALTFLIVDVAGLRTWARPFVWLGVNPLAIYFLSEMVGHLLEVPWITGRGAPMSPKLWLFWSVLEPAMRPWRPEWASLTFSVLFVALWIGAAGTLYWKHLRVAV